MTNTSNSKGWFAEIGAQQATNHFNAKVCKVCRETLYTRGRPRGTTANRGFDLSSRRPSGTSSGEVTKLAPQMVDPLEQGLVMGIM